MALTLSKNQSISLEKTAGSGLTSVSLGLGWDPVKSGGFLSKLLGAAATRSTSTPPAFCWTGT